MNMATYREEEDPFEEDIVFDQAGLLNNTAKMNTAIRRVSSGKCVLFAKTLGLCGAFLGLGLCIAIPGPTFLSPLTQLEANASPISNIYVARSSGYLIGSIIGGVLFDRFNRLFLLFVSLLLTSIFITVTPWCQVFWLLEACMVVLGVAMGFLDTGGNVLCLDLWGRNSGPFMQSLHFSFGLGAFVAPLLAAPFLEPTSFNKSALDADVLNVISDLTIHTTSSKVALFRLDKVNRIRRNVDLNSSQIISDVSENFSSNTSWLSRAYESQSETSSESSLLTMTVSTMSDTLTDKLVITSATVSVQNITIKQKVLKHKPHKIDGSKLGDENWDKVPVREPPPQDLLPPTSTTSSTPSPTSTLTTTTYSPIRTDNLISTFSTSTDTTTIENKYYLNETLSSKSERDEFLIYGLPKSEFSDSLPSSTKFYTEYEGTSSPVDPISIPYSHVQNMNPFNSSPSSESVTKVYKNELTEMSNLKVTPSAPSSILPILPSFSQVNDGTLSSSTLSSLTTMRSHVSELGSSPGENKTEEQHQLMQNSHVMKGNNLSQKEFYVQNPGIASFDANSEIATSFSNILLPSTSEQVIRENATSVKNISLLGHKENALANSSLLPKHVHRKPGTFDNDTEYINTIFDIFANRIEKYGFSKIQFSYLIVGVFVFLISLVFLGFLCHNPRDPKSKQEEGQGSKKLANKLLHKVLTSLMAFFFFLYIGMEVTYGQLVLAFAMHSNLQLAQSTGSVISVVFWGSFAAMRFASIFFASGFSPTTMLILNFVFCTTGTIIVSLLANYVETALWVGTALIGIGLASMFPTGILWIERYIHVSNKVSAIFVIGVSLGQMICPITVYHLMLTNPAMLMHSALIINVVCITTFAASWWLASRQGEKYSVVSNNGYQLANQHDEEEDMMDMSPSASGSAAALRRHSFSSEHRALLNGNLHRGP